MFARESLIRAMAQEARAFATQQQAYKLAEAILDRDTGVLQVQKLLATQDTLTKETYTQQWRELLEGEREYLLVPLELFSAGLAPIENIKKHHIGFIIYPDPLVEHNRSLIASCVVYRQEDQSQLPQIMQWNADGETLINYLGASCIRNIATAMGI